MFIVKQTPDKLTAFRFRLLIAPIGILFAIYIMGISLEGPFNGFQRMAWFETTFFISLGLAFAYFGMHRTVVIFDRRGGHVFIMRAYPLGRSEIETFPYDPAPRFQITRTTSRGKHNRPVYTYELFLIQTGREKIKFGMPAAFIFTIKPTVTRINAWLAERT